MISSFRAGFAACLDNLSRILRRAVTLTLLVPMAAPMLIASSKISLHGPWQFRLDPQNQGEQLGWTSRAPSDTETVNVPHTWNVGKYDDYEGTAWYFRTFTLPADARAKHVELHFGATFYKAHVWLNGAEVGSHEGGHTEYWFDVTLQLSDTNYLAFGDQQPARRRHHSRLGHGP